MTSMYNKLCNKQDGLFLLVCHICIRNKDHQMSLKTHTKHLISSNHFCFMATISSFIDFCNVTRIYKGLHELQGYFKFI